MTQRRLTRLAGWLVSLTLALGAAGSVPAFALGLDPAFPGPPLGPDHAKGVVVWSHGRSITAEDYKSPTPPYLRVLRKAGWDVLRFDRLRDADSLAASTPRLLADVDALKDAGYRKVVLAGQSFGAFLSLMAADRSGKIDAVIATAPAAYGSFDDFYGSWRLNASRLYPLLAAIKSARVMLFYFHGDDYDPGGRGARSRAIMAQRGLPYAVVSQPQYLVGHWAAATGLFVRRFGGCIRDFLADDALSGAFRCTPRWGESPSAALDLPPELRGWAAPSRRPPSPATIAGGTAADGSGAGADTALQPHHDVLDTWYGFYPNGREVLLAVEDVEGNAIDAVYAIGPSIDDRHPAEWTRRSGSIVGDELVFATPGESTLRFRPTEDGGLAATWTAAAGGDSMSAHLRPIPRARPRGQPQ